MAETFWERNRQDIWPALQIVLGIGSILTTLYTWSHPRILPPIPVGAVQPPTNLVAEVINQPHGIPTYLFGTILVFVLAVIIPAFIKLIRGRRFDLSPTPTRNSVGRDNSGRLLQAGSIGTYNEARPLPPPAPPTERPKPNLVSHGIQEVIQTRRNFVFDTNNGDVIYTLRVENSSRGALIRGAVVSIRFIGKDGLLAMVQKAYWYGERPHEIDFELNETRDIVLGKYSDGRWYHFTNPTRYVAVFGRHGDSEPEKPESFSLDESCTMTVEVFNPYRGNDIYLEKRFVVSREANGCTIEEVN